MAKSEPIVYTKPDCPLCDELKDELKFRKIQFEERNIVTRMSWFRLYRHRVPVVVTSDGREHNPPFSPGTIHRLFG